MNPFDDEHGAFTVLVNDELQHSIWPANLDVPAGREVVVGPGSRVDCVSYIEGHWTDIRPASSVRDLRGEAG